MKKPIVLGEDFALPLDAVTGTNAFVGNKGMGKTNGMIRFAEQLIKARCQVVTIDPTDAHWGMKYGKAAGEAGLPVYVLGGNHGDQELQHVAGSLMADVVVDSGASFVLSLRRMKKMQMRTFVAEFLEQLYVRKGEDENRQPTHVIMDEAHLFAPEGMAKEATTCLGAVQDVALLGRSSGIGISFGTQRTAMLSKSVLELCELLVAFRTTGPNARKALLTWMSAHNVDDQADEFFATAAHLNVGEAWAWSPGWLNLFQKVQILQRETFDSSATPRAGQKLNPRGKAAEVDLGKLGEEMRAMEERARDNNPKILQSKLQAEEAKVRALEAAIDLAHNQIMEMRENPVIQMQPVEVPVPFIPPILLAFLENRLPTMIDSIKTTLEAGVDEMDDIMASLLPVIDNVKQTVQHQAEDKAKLFENPVKATATNVPLVPPLTIVKEPIVYRDPNDALNPLQRKILTALAQHINGLSRARLALMVGHRTKGPGYFSNMIGKLRSMGLIAESKDPIIITDAGMDALGPFESLPTGPALLAWWCANGEGMAELHRNILMTLGEYGGKMDKALLASKFGYEPTGPGYFANTLGKLRSIGLITESKDPIALNSELL